MPRVLFAVGAWGLGHATRDLPLIEGLLARGCHVTVASSGQALEVLAQHLGGRCPLERLPEMPTPLGRSAPRFYARFLLSLGRVLRWVQQDRRAVEALLRAGGYDAIVSDNRYGAASPYVPSYHIAHQVRFIAPGRNRALERALLAVHAALLAPACRIFVPDTGATPSLSGDLAHGLPPTLARRVRYLGILSSLEGAANGDADPLDYFITLSGPEPQRTLLQEAVLRQLPALPGRGVVALGIPCSPLRLRVGGADVYGFLPRRQQGEAMARSRVVAARGGYTTLMELAALGKRAVLVPTPGQTEQEYLAAYHRSLGTFHGVSQRRLRLAEDLPRALEGRGFPAPNTTREAVEVFVRELLG